jgi:hypothetical protein
MPKRRESPEFVCVERAQLPLEGVLAAHTISRTFTKATQPTRPQEAMNSVVMRSAERYTDQHVCTRHGSKLQARGDPIAEGNCTKCSRRDFS